MKFFRIIAFIGLFMFSYFPQISMAQEVAEDSNHEGYVEMIQDATLQINEPDVERLDQELESNSDENMIQQENPTLVEPSLVEPSLVEPIDVAVEPSTNLEEVEEDAAATVSNMVEIAQFTAKDRFFEVTEDKVPIYDNSTGSLQVVGYLNKGQEFPRVADYGPDWHQIKYRNGYGYIYKPATKPSNGSTIHNMNPNLKASDRSIKATSKLSVYDNSSGSLVPFAALHKNTVYPVLADYGNWYQIDVSGRIGYVYKPATITIFKPSDRYFIPGKM